MKTLAERASAEIEVKNSRFLAEAFVVTDQEEARAVIRAQKEKYPDARHVAHAFAIGPTAGILGCSDDGEPSGTAGRPALEALKGSGLTNALVTVTRWFGGTLLGTGGLVRAYTDAVKAVLAVAPVEELVETRGFSFAVSYELHARARRVIADLGADIEREEFGTEVFLSGRVVSSDADALASRLTDCSSGRIAVTLSQESRTGRRT